MKSSNIFGVHRKIRLVGGFTKNQYIGGRGDCLKSETWTVCRFKRVLRKKEEGGGGGGGSDV